MTTKRKPPAGDMIRQSIARALAERGLCPACGEIGASGERCQACSLDRCSDGLPQAELARRSGTGPVAVSRFLRSERDVTTRVANRMLAALGLEIK